MPNQTVSQSPSVSERNIALRNLYEAIVTNVDSHVDNPQLLLFIGITLNDLDIVRSCMEYENLDANQGITARNQHILEQFGCSFDSPRSVIH